MRWLKKLLMLLFLLGLLVLVVIHVDFSRLLDQLYRLRVLPLFGIILFLVLFFLLWNFRWWYSLRLLGKVSFWRLLPVLMAGAFVNTVTPFAGLASEPVRAVYATRMMRKPGMKVFMMTLLEKLFTTVVVVCFLAFSFLFIVIRLTDFPLLQGVALTLFILMMLGIILFVVLLRKVGLRKLLLVDMFLHLIYLFRSFSSYLQRFSSQEKFSLAVHRELDRAKHFIAQWLRIKHFFVISLLITFLLVAANFLTMYFSFLAFQVEISFIVLVVVYTLANVLSDLTFIPGGVGLLEILNIFLLSAFGIPFEVATLVTLLNRVVFYVFALGIGYGCLVYLHIKE